MKQIRAYKYYDPMTTAIFMSVDNEVRDRIATATRINVIHGGLNRWLSELYETA
jgi:hypothetical protein